MCCIAIQVRSIFWLCIGIGKPFFGSLLLNRYRRPSYNRTDPIHQTPRSAALLKAWLLVFWAVFPARITLYTYTRLPFSLHAGKGKICMWQGKSAQIQSEMADTVEVRRPFEPVSGSGSPTHLYCIEHNLDKEYIHRSRDKGGQ